MLLEAEQSFGLRHPGGEAAALAFVRDPQQSLAQVRFLRGLQSAEREGGGAAVSGELIVSVPAMGEVDLPFRSALEQTPHGAALLPLNLSGERAWVEVSGQAEVSGGEMQFHFQFRAHLTLPSGEGWGSAAFEKMVQAAAARTLARVAAALPQGIAAALPVS